MKKILCFGDSNTWGYNPVTKDRYSDNVRWTGILQKKLSEYDISVVEEGLCGRTTVFEDRVRPGRKGIDAILPLLFKNSDIDGAIIMLGTNDCKTFYNATAKQVAEGVRGCLERLKKYLPAGNILLISPIALGADVWREEFDPEFSPESVLVSKELPEEYLKVANSEKVHFLAASEYAFPSREDNEHLNVEGHRALAEAVFKKVCELCA